MIPDSFVEELKYVCDIKDVISSYVALQNKGRTLTGLCPFHSERTPSFTVYPETQSYYCFGCGNGGDVITFIREIENLDYVETLHFLADRSGLTVPESDASREAAQQRTRVLEINRQAARFFHQCLLSDAGGPSRNYLMNQRGLESRTIRTYGIGYAPEGWDNLRNHLRSKGFSQEEMLAAAVVSQGRSGSVYDLFRDRVIFPIIDLRGNVIGFGGRLMGERGPKYINSPDTPVFKKSRQLYSLNFAKNSDSDTLILGEGYMDVIAMYQAGFDNAVATLGTALTSEQSRLIAQYARKAVIAYDADAAGQSAAKRAINLFADTNVSVSVLQLQDAKDPDEFIQKHGAARFAHLLEGGQSAMDFEISKLKHQYDLAVSEEKVAFLGDFCRLMAGVHNPLQRDVYIGEIAEELGASKESLLSTVAGLRKKEYYSRKRSDSRKLASSISPSAGTQSQRRRKNLEGVVAEELLLTMLLYHPDSYKTIKDTLTPDDFQDPGYRQMFTLLAQRIENGQPLELIHFSSQLSSELMAKLSQLLLRGQEIKFYPEQALEYARAIKAQQTKRDSKQLAEMSPEEYADYMNSLRAEKQ